MVWNQSELTVSFVREMTLFLSYALICLHSGVLLAVKVLTAPVVLHSILPNMIRAVRLTLPNHIWQNTLPAYFRK